MERMHAEVIKFARESRGLTQYFADPKRVPGAAIHIQQTSLSAWESARRPVGEDALERIAEAMGITVWQMFAEYVGWRRAGKPRRKSDGTPVRREHWSREAERAPVDTVEEAP